MENEVYKDWVRKAFIGLARLCIPCPLSHEEPLKGLKPGGKIMQIFLQQFEEPSTERKKGEQKGS